MGYREILLYWKGRLFKGRLITNNIDLVIGHEWRVMSFTELISSNLNVNSISHLAKEKKKQTADESSLINERSFHPGLAARRENIAIRSKNRASFFNYRRYNIITGCPVCLVVEWSGKSLKLVVAMVVLPLRLPRNIPSRAGKREEET